MYIIYYRVYYTCYDFNSLALVISLLMSAFFSIWINEITVKKILQFIKNYLKNIQVKF